jgi:glycosyltransferase involved in cell wall biosynthesis
LTEKQPVPPIIIGGAPTIYLQSLTNNLPHGGRVYFVADATNEQVHAAYALAQVFLFPSLEEGFGWPIAEAMACGCPVITTDQAPMTEVGGDAAIYIPRKPSRVDAETWATKCSNTLQGVLDLPSPLRHAQTVKGFNNVSRFNVKMTMDAYEAAYRKSGSSLALVKQRLNPSKSCR